MTEWRAIKGDFVSSPGGNDHVNWVSEADAVRLRQ